MDRRMGSYTTVIYLIYKPEKCLVNCLTIMLGVFGLSSHYYVPRRDKYYASGLMLAYAAFAYFAFSVIYLKGIYDDYVYGFDLTNVSKLYAYMNIMASVMSYATGILHHKRMPIFMNKAKVVETIDFFDINNEMMSTPMLVVVLRPILFLLATEVALVMHQKRNAPDQSLLWTLYILFPTITAQIMPNCVFGVFVLWKMYITALNMQLSNISNEINYMQRKEQITLQKPYYRMQRFCELADKLDILAEKYLVIGYQCMEYLEMYGVTYVCALICNLFGITVGFYIQYYAIADTLINGDSFDAFNAVTNGMFLSISLGDVIFLANLSNENLVTLRKTGNILQSMALEHADVRFKQSVEAFTLVAYSNRFKIKPLGLFEINVSIIHDVSSAVTSFLLILIQSDLALRFSLK